MSDSSVTFFGPLDAVLGQGDVMVYVLLVLVLVNMVTRKLANDRHRRQADDDEIERWLPHEATNVLLVLGSFYYLTLHHHSGIIVAALAITVYVADIFEFEARAVEVRNDMPVEQPAGSIAASVLTLLYVGYLSLFFVIAPVWNQLI